MITKVKNDSLTQRKPDYIRYDCGCCGWETIEDWRESDVCPKCNHKPMGKTELYTTPPAPVCPETLPCPVLLEPGMRFGKGVRTQTMLTALQCRADYYASLDAMTPEERAEHDANIAAFKAMLPQPAKVVPEEMYWQDAPVEGSTRASAYATGWNACRAAMLKGETK